MILYDNIVIVIIMVSFSDPTVTTKSLDGFFSTAGFPLSSRQLQPLLTLSRCRHCSEGAGAALKTLNSEFTHTLLSVQSATSEPMSVLQWGYTALNVHVSHNLFVWHYNLTSSALFRTGSAMLRDGLFTGEKQPFHINSDLKREKAKVNKKEKKEPQM